ncbi:hypothetical protein PP707_08545 [Acetobacter pasteurianus]|nr:hypothetical protein [Acetobacter pasteurianus]
MMIKGGEENQFDYKAVAHISILYLGSVLECYYKTSASIIT